MVYKRLRGFKKMPEGRELKIKLNLKILKMNFIRNSVYNKGGFYANQFI